MRSSTSIISLAIGLGLAVTGVSRPSFAFTEAVEFDVSLQSTPGKPPDPLPLDGWRLSRVKVFELVAGAHGEAFYTEEIGYVRYDDGQAHLVLGATAPEAFRLAFKLDGDPDESMFSRPLSVQLEVCTRVRRGAVVDSCEDGPDAWQQQGPEVPLNAVPLAMSVAQVPLYALPDEVVLQDELDAALAAERQAYEAAIEAVRASIAAEQARALQAEAALRNDLDALAEAERQAMAAEEAARQAADAALAAELAAEQAARTASDIDLASQLASEAVARQSGDQQAIATAQSIAYAGDQGVLSALASPGGAAVHYSNLVGVPASATRLDVITVMDQINVRADCVLGIGFGKSDSVSVHCPDGYAMTGCSGSTAGDGDFKGADVMSNGDCASFAVGHCAGTWLWVTAMCARVVP